MSAATNRYSENVAELLLLERTELDDFNDARDSLEGSLDRLELLIRDELALIPAAGDRPAEEAELARVAEMRSLYEDIDRRTQRLLQLRDQQRLSEAIQIFREEIEDSLDTTLEVHIGAAIADEEAELAATRTGRTAWNANWNGSSASWPRRPSSSRPSGRCF